MRHRILPLVLLALAIAAPCAAAGTFATKQRQNGRVAAAWKAHQADVRETFRAAAAAWPPQDVFLRAFKAEGAIELWAAPEEGERLVRVKTFPICAASGVLGPKQQAGDGQVPEGFYAVDRFNPWSSYHLSLGLDYPNAVDRARAAGRSPGGDIFIHGNCVTIGCLPILDEPVEWLYVALVMARDAGQRTVPVHVFPCRFESASCQTALAAAGAADPELTRFWEAIRVGYDAFVSTGKVPRSKATKAGYTITPK